VARAEFNDAAGGSPVYQLVSSALHHGLPWYAPPLLRVGWNPALAAVVRSVARRFGVPDPRLSWRLLSPTVFDNAVATLKFSGRNATLMVESSRHSGQLEVEFQVELARVSESRGVIDDEGVHRR
jgi:hypothetical protein